MKTIAVTGSSGFIGINFKKKFKAKGFKIYSIKRDELKDLKKLTQIIEKSDYIVNLAGANIINRWTKTYKQILYSSRIDTTKALIKAISLANKTPQILISASAIGIYKSGACYDEFEFEYNEDFLGNLCKTWENEALKAKKYSVRTVVFRFGIVLGDGGALQKMIRPFKLGLGGTISNGTQDFSFIHIEDLLNAYEFVFNNNTSSGIYNLSAPNPTTNLGLTKALAKALHKIAILPMPKFALNLILGEGAKVLTQGQCIKPKRLLDEGFKFKFENINTAINNLIS